MSDLVSKQQAAVALQGDTFSPLRDHHHHPPHVAHHFQSAEQQYASAKVGMWVFLATELLMFGGLFCAYSVYRHNHPEVFEYAHHYLDKFWGAFNTVVLITSSLTMAWGVRLAQLGKKTGLVICLALTLLGGLGFMIVKTIEYSHKYHERVWIGSGNQYSKIYNGPKIETGPTSGLHSESPGMTQGEREAAGDVAKMAKPTTPASQPVGNAWIDPNAGTADEARLKPTQFVPAGLSPAIAAQHHDERPRIEYADLPQLEKDRVATFFSIYFLMTGLHGLHVLIGMGLITWILFRALQNEFGPRYFTPVDLVGLYWHLVDLIWIFLFPLLYLIH